MQCCPGGSAVKDQLNQSTVDVLTEIWQRVLQQPSIHPDDNFFHLGGNDSLADKLFAEITQVLGRELPSATIFRAPTIASLSTLLAKSTLPRFSPFVPLKAGVRNPPILITHGVGGRASFSKLANHIHTAHPVYGIQAKGVDGMEDPYERIEDMASFYLEELDRLQGQGPYILIGYSFGGLVALEMAQRLSSDEKKVALLVLVDTYPDPQCFPLSQRLWLVAKRARGHLAEMKKMPIRTAFAYLARGLKHRLRSAADHGATKPSRLSLAQTTARVKESDFRAMARYRPRFYKGKIRFVRPEYNSYLPNNPTALWKPLASELEVETVPGDHLGMVGEHFESLAAVLTRYVQESIDGK
jgi:thioesterase domain-containing protein